MKPVNLLPAEHRPRGGGAGARPGSGYAVLGALAVVLVAALAYVYTLNSATDRRNETVRLEAETKQLERRAAELGSFADFRQMKQTRLLAVREVAGRRFDWERLLREMAHLTPGDVWFTNFQASLSGAAAASSATGAPAPGGTSGAAAAGGAAGSGAAGAVPTVSLEGCAPSQQRVADVLLRLRMLDQAKEVKLADSSRGEKIEGAAPAGPAGVGATDGCGERRGRPNFKFNATIELEPAPPAAASKPAAARTPSSLGGGS